MCFILDNFWRLSLYILDIWPLSLSLSLSLPPSLCAKTSVFHLGMGTETRYLIGLGAKL